MAWTTPKTWTAGTLTVADFNLYISDNLSILKTPAGNYYTANESSNYTTTSTSFTNVDGTDTEGKFRHTLDCQGGDIMIHFDGTLNTGSNTNIAYFEVTMDGVGLFGDSGLIGWNQAAATIYVPVSFTRIIPKATATAGSHIFRLQWRVTSGTLTMYAGAGTASLDLHPQFWVREVS